MTTTINADDGVVSGSSGLKNSADASGILALQTNGTTAVTISATQTTTFAGDVTAPSVTTTGTINTANTFGFKNRIINGGMTIDQRNAGAATANTINGYTLDRWIVQQTVTGKLIAQQNAGAVTSPAGFTKYLGVTSQSAYSIAAGNVFGINQLIEGFNIADLGWGTANAKTVTLSFQVYSSLTGTFGGALNNNSNYSYPFSYAIPVANTWTTISVTVAGPTSGTWTSDNSAGISVYFGLGVGSTYSGTAGSWSANYYLSATGATSVVGTNGATFYITGVQLEVGSQATSFDFRSYGTELNLCQRYYQAFVEGGGYFHLGSAISSSQVRGPRFTFFQTMRTNPSITLPTAGTGAGQMYYCQTSGAAASVGNFTAQQIRQDSFFLEGETWTGVTTGSASLLAAGSGGVTIAVSAEL